MSPGDFFGNSAAPAALTFLLTVVVYLIATGFRAGREKARLDGLGGLQGRLESLGEMLAEIKPKIDGLVQRAGEDRATGQKWQEELRGKFHNLSGGMQKLATQVENLQRQQGEFKENLKEVSDKTAVHELRLALLLAHAKVPATESQK